MIKIRPSYKVILSNIRCKDRGDIQTVKDNLSAFDSTEYDLKIKQTLPYYEDFFDQTAELVKTKYDGKISWLDVGCGTGKMGSIALNDTDIDIGRFVFCDSSREMTDTACKRFKSDNTEFNVCDARKLTYINEFDVVTAIQVFHYFDMKDRRTAVKNCYDALKENGSFITFENISPFTDIGTDIYLKRWERYQVRQGKTPDEARKHIQRYGKDYFPITINEHLKLMQDCGFKAVEIIWLSNMQAGVWGIK